MSKRYISLPAINRRVPLGAYVNYVKLAKANPDREFKHGLSCWWQCLGKEVVQQFREGMNERINAGIPAIKRGL
jgi:hypothetical protein